MKHKKIKIAAALVVVGLIGGVIYNQVTAKNYQCFDNHPVIFKDVNEELVSLNYS